MPLVGPNREYANPDGARRKTATARSNKRRMVRNARAAAAAATRGSDADVEDLDSSPNSSESISPSAPAEPSSQAQQSAQQSLEWKCYTAADFPSPRMSHATPDSHMPQEASYAPAITTAPDTTALTGTHHVGQPPRDSYAPQPDVTQSYQHIAPRNETSSINPREYPAAYAINEYYGNRAEGGYTQSRGTTGPQMSEARSVYVPRPPHPCQRQVSPPTHTQYTEYRNSGPGYYPSRMGPFMRISAPQPLPPSRQIQSQPWNTSMSGSAGQAFNFDDDNDDYMHGGDHMTPGCTPPTGTTFQAEYPYRGTSSLSRVNSSLRPPPRPLEPIREESGQPESGAIVPTPAPGRTSTKRSRGTAKTPATNSQTWERKSSEWPNSFTTARFRPAPLWEAVLADHTRDTQRQQEAQPQIEYHSGDTTEEEGEIVDPSGRRGQKRVNSTEMALSGDGSQSGERSNGPGALSYATGQTQGAASETPAQIPAHTTPNAETEPARDMHETKRTKGPIRIKLVGRYHREMA
ncbi:hypothetical protein GGS26DRAFT_535834, partial [Hypomontagnella submonticulosa]